MNPAGKVAQSDVPDTMLALLAELALFLTKLGMPAEATIIGRGLAELSPASPAGVLLQGYAAFAAGKVTEAEKHYRSALQRSPEDATVRAFLGESLIAQRRFREAEDLLTKAAAGDGSGARLANELLAGVRQGIFAR